MSTEEAAFQAIKKVFLTTLVLQHFDPDKECTVKTNISDYVSAIVFSQLNYKSVLRPVAFMLCQHLPAECNYRIYNKKLLAII